MNLNINNNVKPPMKSEGGLVVSLNSELTSYFKEHPEDLPSTVDVNALEVSCSSYLIEHIENYTTKPFMDKFLWSVVFPTSKVPGFEYKYFITYKATCNGEHGVVKASLVNSSRVETAPWYSYN